MKVSTFKKNLGKLLMGTLFALCFTTTAFAADLPGNSGGSKSEDVSTYGTEVLLNMRRITVRPTYTNSSGKLTTASGYYYNRSGNFEQAVHCDVTTAQQSKMKSNVESLGYKQVGYEISVDYSASGTFTNGNVTTKNPFGTPIQWVYPNVVKTTTFYTELSSPDLRWSGSFNFRNSNNRDLSLLLQASATFE